MTATQENFVSWLRDAHAAEEQAITMLTAQASRLEHYPALRTRIEEHIRETEAQESAVAKLLERHEAGSSAMKDVSGKVMAAFQGMTGAIAPDEVMKGCIASYAFENMEIASYRILISTAEQLGDTEAVSVLRNILDQEIAMADWLKANLDDVTRAFLVRAEADMDAKR